VRWQPVSPTLMTHLLNHADERHAPPEEQLLRYADGRAITRRRYDYLWRRLGQHLPWVATQHGRVCVGAAGCSPAAGPDSR
jgi:integrase/recombinase XerC